MNSPLHPVDEVVEYLLQNVECTADSTVRNLDDALGRYLSRDIHSPVNVPPAPNSSMDGYAFDARDKSIAIGGVYEISDRIPAGQAGRMLAPGTLARIFTGAPMPEGADTVVIQEDTTRVENRIQINNLPEPGENVRPRGQDIRQDSAILSRGRCLRSEDLGLAASVGLSELDIFKPLKIAIMSTGDELVEPPGKLAPGQIYNANRYALAGLLHGLGMEVLDLGLVADTQEATRDVILKGAGHSDCILCSGGVSVGEEDHVRAAVESLGTLDIWRLAIKPGKPLAFGQVDGKPFFGLPGNPVSTYVTFMMIARPFLIALQGGCDPIPVCYYGRADFNYRTGNRREYLRVRIVTNASGEVYLHKFHNQGSGIMSSVSWADALAEVETGQQVCAGDLLKYYLI